MKTIPAQKTTLPDGTDVLTPATPLPHDRTLTVCDGTNYTVYEPGDTLPLQG